MTRERELEINQLITDTREYLSEYPSPDDLILTSVWLTNVPAYLSSLSYAIGEVELEEAVQKLEHLKTLGSPEGSVSPEKWKDIKHSSTLVNVVLDGLTASYRKAKTIMTQLRKDLFDATDNSRAISYCNRKEKHLNV